MIDAAYADRRRAVVGLAMPLLATGDAQWDTALATYLACEALSFADLQFGAYRAFDNDDELKRFDLKERFGRNWRSHPDAKEEVEALCEGVVAAERKRDTEFLAPHWQSARALANTPAPNFAAALWKVELIEFEDLGNDLAMPRDAFGIVAEDMARFEGEAA